MMCKEAYDLERMPLSYLSLSYFTILFSFSDITSIITPNTNKNTGYNAMLVTDATHPNKGGIKVVPT